MYHKISHPRNYSGIRVQALNEGRRHGSRHPPPGAMGPAAILAPSTASFLNPEPLNPRHRCCYPSAAYPGGLGASSMGSAQNHGCILPPSSPASNTLTLAENIFGNCDRLCHIGILNCGQTLREALPKPRTQEANMTRQITVDEFCDCYEYYGSTTIAHKRTLGGETVWKDWILFDTVEEASEYFNAASVN